MNAQRTAILTDSGTDTPRVFAAAHDVRVVPLGISYSDGSRYRAGVDIDEDEVVRRFAEEIPTTSLPSPEDIRLAFEQARADGYERAVYVGISSGLSATCDTVRLVASSLEDFPVTVVDTKSIGAAAGMVVMGAAEMVEEGVPYERLGERLALLSRETHVFFCVKDLTWLHEGGRIDELTFRLGSLLDVKPIIWCDEDGHYRTYKKPRGWERALRQELRCVRSFARAFSRVRVAIACTPAADRFDELAARVREDIGNAYELVRSGISAALVVHTGPELVGMGVQPDWRLV